MNSQESNQYKNQFIHNDNTDSEILDYQTNKFVSADVVQLHNIQKSKPFTPEDIGLDIKLYHTPPRAPRLRPQPVPRIQSSMPFQLPQSQFNPNEKSKSPGIEQRKFSFGLGVSSHITQDENNSSCVTDSTQKQTEEFNFDSNLSLTYAALQQLELQGPAQTQQNELTSFIQQPISSFLRQRYESIDTTVTMQDYALSGVNMIAVLQQTAPSREQQVDFTLTLSQDFDMKDFMSANSVLESDQHDSRHIQDSYANHSISHTITTINNSINNQSRFQDIPNSFGFHNLSLEQSSQ